MQSGAVKEVPILIDDSDAQTSLSSIQFRKIELVE